MAEELLGPDLSASIKASPEQVEVISKRLSKGEDLNDEIKTILWDSLTTTTNQIVEDNNYEHDGFHFTWELSGVYKFEADELIVNSSINVNVKSDDFDFFNAILQEDKNLATLMATLEEQLATYLETGGISKESYTIKAESDGFGYG